MGKRMAKLGRKIVLSSYAVEHRIGSQDWRANLSHRLRWNRSTRRSRPVGYAGQLFTHALPLAVGLALWRPGWWALSAVVASGFMAATSPCVAHERGNSGESILYMVTGAGSAELRDLVRGLLRAGDCLAHASDSRSTVQGGFSPQIRDWRAQTRSNVR